MTGALSPRVTGLVLFGFVSQHWLQTVVQTVQTAVQYILFCGFGFFCLALFGLIWCHLVLYISPGQPCGK